MRSGTSAYTLGALAVLACLAVYIVVTGDPFGYTILALAAVFIGVPALVIFLLRRREGARHADEAPTPPSSSNGSRGER